jgi:hypothetical protein
MNMPKRLIAGMIIGVTSSALGLTGVKAAISTTTTAVAPAPAHLQAWLSDDWGKHHDHDHDRDRDRDRERDCRLDDRFFFYCAKFGVQSPKFDDLFGDEDVPHLY